SDSLVLGSVWPQALFLYCSRGPTPARSSADASPRIRSSSAPHGRRRCFFTARGAPPPLALPLMPRLGFACPRLRIAAGAVSLLLAGPHPRSLFRCCLAS